MPGREEREKKEDSSKRSNVGRVNLVAGSRLSRLAFGKELEVKDRFS
jgi:hypothetical protein